MADVASLVVRVNAEGADKAAKQLNDLNKQAEGAASGVADLTAAAVKSNPQVKKAGEAAAIAAKQAGSMKAGVQNLSFQLQDFIVQTQMGTSALSAFGQQAPQLLGSFGAIGAALGVAAALLPAVAKLMDDGTVSAGALSAATETLNGVLGRTADGSYQAAEALDRLVQSGASAAEIQAKLASASDAIEVTLKAQAQAAKEAVGEMDTLSYGSAIGAARTLELGESTASLTGYLGNLSDKLGITNEEARKLAPLMAAVQKNATPENIKALADETNRLATSQDNSNAELNKLNGSMQDYATRSRDAKAEQAALGDVIGTTTARMLGQNQAILDQALIANMSARDQVKARRQIDEANFQGNAAQTLNYSLALDERERRELKAIDDREKATATSTAKSIAADNERAAKQGEQQQKQAQAFIATLARQNSDELAAIDAQEQQKLAKLQEFQQQGLVGASEFEAAKTQIITDATVARNEHLDKLAEEQKQKQFSADSFISQIQAQNEGELAEIDRQQEAKLAKLQKFYDDGLVAEKDYQKAREAIAEDADKQRLDSYTGTLDDVTSALKTSLEEGNALYKAAAITQTIIETYKGATAAYASLATIPVVGPALGIAAAAAITAAGLANVGKIRSAREQGGNLAAGQASTIAERGKVEVIMPAGASRVRTAQQMRQIMGENPSNSGSDSVVIVNQTTSRIDNAQTERDDEGRLRVIISEQVSAEMMDSNSPISKSRKASRGQPGF